MSSGAQSDIGEGWTQALDAARALTASLRALLVDRDSAIASMRVALLDPVQRTEAMTVLGQLAADYTEAVLPELMIAALSHRDTHRVRRLLGQLPCRAAARSVPAAVWRQLAETPDDDAYRRMAELLDHLGLADALATLVSRAENSSDEAMREIAEDFRR
jgi:hypothetical protein